MNDDLPLDDKFEIPKIGSIVPQGGEFDWDCFGGDWGGM